MDRRIESFLGDVLALAGEEPDAVHDGVRVALAKCEAIFRLQEPKKRMRDQAAHACRALCRARVADELQRRRGTRIGEHLKMVLSFSAGGGAGAGSGGASGLHRCVARVVKYLERRVKRRHGPRAAVKA